MDCGKKALMACLAIVPLMTLGCDRQSRHDDAGPILVSAVSALERSTVRPLEGGKKIESFLVGPGIAQSVASDAARIRPTSIAKQVNGHTRLEAGEVLIKEFRMNDRAAHVTMLVGPADYFPAPGRPPDCGSTEKMTFKELSGRWVLTEREQVVC